ncbi:Peptidase T, partial [Haemophilus influenzae]
LLMILT